MRMISYKVRFYVERPPNSDFDYLHIYLESSNTDKVVVRIPHLEVFRYFKLEICSETNRDNCYQDVFNTVFYVNSGDTQSLYQNFIKDKYKVCGFGLGYFEAMKTYDKLIIQNDKDNFDQNAKKNQGLLFTDASMLMTFVSVSVEMDYPDYLALNDKLHCGLNFPVTNLQPTEFSKNQNSLKMDQKDGFTVIKLYYSNENDLLPKNEAVIPPENYKSFPAISNNTNIQTTEDNLGINLKINTEKQKTSLSIKINSPKCDTTTEFKIQNVSDFNYAKSSKIRLVPMICKDKVDQQPVNQLGLYTLGEEKCEMVLQNNLYEIENNNFKENGNPLNDELNLNFSLTGFTISNTQEKLKNYLAKQCGLLNKCSLAFDSKNKILFLRCYANTYLMEKNKKEILPIIRKDKDFQNFDFSFPTNRRILLTEKYFQFWHWKTFSLIGSVIIGILIAGLVVTSGAWWMILLAVIFGMLAGVCCFLGRFFKAAQNGSEEGFKIKMNQRILPKKTKDVFDFYEKRFEDFNSKINIWKESTNNKHQLYLEINNYDENCPLFLESTKPMSLEQYKNNLESDLDKWTRENEHLFNLLEDADENAEKQEINNTVKPKTMNMAVNNNFDENFDEAGDDENKNNIQQFQTTKMNFKPKQKII